MSTKQKVMVQNGKMHYGFKKEFFIDEIFQLLQKDTIFGHFELHK